MMEEKVHYSGLLKMIQNNRIFIEDSRVGLNIVRLVSDTKRKFGLRQLHGRTACEREDGLFLLMFRSFHYTKI